MIEFVFFFQCDFFFPALSEEGKKGEHGYLRGLTDTFLRKMR